MPSKHIETRRKLMAIADINDFLGLLDRCVLTEEDKTLMKMHYIDGKDFRYIGDALGFSERCVKERHRRIVSKISHLL